MRFPSCEGRLPLKLLRRRSLREGRRSGIMVRIMVVASASSAFPLGVALSPEPCGGLPLFIPQPLVRAKVAYSSLNAARSPNCEGKLPLRLLL